MMGISFLATIILAVLLFVNPFTESAVWIVTGIVLLVLAVLDTLYFILGRTNKEAAQ
jgi:UDP-N-acetylmuramyl pentapeptide phosphotransferase/UDP-N-acetylglucosamine-1-phosphate transferase